MNIIGPALLGIGLLLTGCSETKQALGRAQVTNTDQLGALPGAPPPRIYVSDFELEAAAMEPGDSLLAGRRVGRRLRGEPEDPVAYAAKLVDLMAATLVADLGKHGIPAHRLAANEARPASGWLIRGVFTEVDEGNRLRRAVIGFGAGATEMELYVDVSDLSTGAAPPFYSFDTAKGSGKLPGAIITLNPYVAAAKFVLSKKSLERDVKGTASKIASQVADQVKRTNPD